MTNTYTLGLDVGSSSIKAALISLETGRAIAQASSPQTELAIDAPKPGFAEQHPDLWWEHVCKSIAELKRQTGESKLNVKSIGIAYQMHGLVTLDADMKPVRPSIIWCDSRAVALGDRAFNQIGAEKCREHLLNSPGNFTASKLAWIKENEPAAFKRVKKICLPGDYIALKLTGELVTSRSGLSEGILWDFKKSEPAKFVLENYGINPEVLPEAVPSFSVSGKVRPEVAAELGISENAVVSYRSGDQPNNAFSLKVLEPGEVAATAGTSGVVYGVTEKRACDPESRVNTFLHVNSANGAERYGVLLCVNGTGSLNRWLKNEWGRDYKEMNALAAHSPIGSRGVSYLPYGNGAERTLKNKNPGAELSGLDLNTHTRADVFRAAQEGIAFALRYGFEALKVSGVTPQKIRVGVGNMFLSPVFCEAFTNSLNVPVELYATDGAQGAARGGALGAKLFTSVEETFSGLSRGGELLPDASLVERYDEAYERWLKKLNALYVE